MLRFRAFPAVALVAAACSPATLGPFGGDVGQPEPHGSDAAAAASPGSAAPGSASAAPPPAGVAVDAHLPEIDRGVLDNGLSLSVVAMPAARLVDLRLVLRSGSATDGPNPGLARLTVEQVRAGGAGPWSARQLQDQLDEIGAALDVRTTLDTTCFELRVASERVEKAVAWLATLATRPRLNLASLSRARLRLGEQARERTGFGIAFTAEAVLHRELFRLPTDRHPYARIGANAEQLQSLTLADTQGWLRTHVTPENALLVVVGNVQAAAMRSAAEQALRSWRGAAPPALTYPAPLPPPRLEVQLVNHPKSATCELRLGMLGPDLLSEQMPALEVAMQLLGERIHRLAPDSNVRLLGVLHGPAPVVIAARTTTADAPRLAQSLLGELTTLAEHAPSAAEVEGAARLLCTDLRSVAETSRGIGWLVELSELRGVASDYFDARPAQWRAVASRDVHEAARSYLSPDHALLVLSGDATRLAKPLSHFGTVRVLDPARGMSIQQKLDYNPSAPLRVESR